MSSLFIIPNDPLLIPENDRFFAQALLELGFLGAPWPVPEGSGFLLGERFFQLVSFAGCAPGLRLEPASPADEQFCHIRLLTEARPQFRFLREERPARCPACGKPGVRAGEFARQQFTATTHWHCPSCRQSVASHELQWRREAGLARYAIEIRDVYPHEGVPTDYLLQRLEEISAVAWSWFYA